MDGHQAPKRHRGAVITATSSRAGRGLLIAFEGGEGAGKSSQIGRLATALRQAGRTVVVTHEPGATTVGRQIRRLLLDTDEPIAPRSEALLFAADRAHHVATVIRPALSRGEVVITDRFVDSSLAYQGAGRTLALGDVKRLSRWATEDLVPDLTVLLDIAPEVGLARVHGRGEATVETGPAGSGGTASNTAGPDRLEREALGFHERVRAGFRDLADAEPDRYLVLDAGRPIDELAMAIADRVEQSLASRAVLPTGPSAGSQAPPKLNEPSGTKGTRSR